MRDPRQAVLDEIADLSRGDLEAVLAYYTDDVYFEDVSVPEPSRFCAEASTASADARDGASVGTPRRPGYVRGAIRRHEDYDVGNLARRSPISAKRILPCLITAHCRRPDLIRTALNRGIHRGRRSCRRER